MRQSGDVEILADDWSLADGGLSIARIYRVRGGPQDGRWAWFVQVGPDGAPRNGGAGYADDGRTAREACEALLPKTLKDALKRQLGQ